MKLFSLIVMFWTLLPLSVSADDKQIRVVASPFPPMTDPALEQNGWFWEICQAALESQGYSVSITFSPWARALKEARDGRYDAITPIYRTVEREQWFLYSQSIESIRTGFFKLSTRPDIGFSGDLTEMKSYSIGVGRGYSVSDAFDQADFLDKHEVVSTSVSLKMLWNNRLDLIVGDEQVERFTLDQINQQPAFTGIKAGVVFIEPPLQTRTLHLAISKNATDYAVKMADFNRGLQHIRDTGEYQRILERHGIAVE